MVSATASTQSWTRSVGRTLQRPQFWFGLLVLAPLIGYYLLFLLGPVFLALFMSMHAFNPLNPDRMRFVGLANFQSVVQEPLFYTALQNTALYTVYFFAIFPISLILAALINEVTRLRQFYIFAVFAPVVMSLVPVVLLFRWLYDPFIGPLNYGFGVERLPRRGFRTGHERVRAAVG